MNKIDLRNLTLEELQSWTTGLGLEPYRAEQISRWIFQPDIRTFDQMTNLSKKWRGLFQEQAYLSQFPDRIKSEYITIIT